MSTIATLATGHKLAYEDQVRSERHDGDSANSRSASD
jgi:hypothetical protein